MNKFLDIPIPTVILEETYLVGVEFIKDYGRNIVGAAVVVTKHLPDGRTVVVHSKIHYGDFEE